MDRPTHEYLLVVGCLPVEMATIVLLLVGGGVCSMVLMSEAKKQCSVQPKIKFTCSIHAGGVYNCA